MVLVWFGSGSEVQVVGQVLVVVQVQAEVQVLVQVQVLVRFSGSVVVLVRFGRLVVARVRFWLRFRNGSLGSHRRENHQYLFSKKSLKLALAHGK